MTRPVAGAGAAAVSPVEGCGDCHRVLRRPSPGSVTHHWGLRCLLHIIGSRGCRGRPQQHSVHDYSGELNMFSHF